MAAQFHESTLCVNCLALLQAGAQTPGHHDLGRARPEVGYDLYRCMACHAHWSHGPSGWVNETTN